MGVRGRRKPSEGVMLEEVCGCRRQAKAHESTARADSPKANPVSIANLLATVLHVLLDDETRRRIAVLPGAVAATVSSARPIAPLL